MKKYREEMNTYNEWQRKGYQVKRNQHSAYSKNNSPLFGRSQVARKKYKNNNFDNLCSKSDETGALGGIILVIIVAMLYGYLN